MPRPSLDVQAAQARLLQMRAERGILARGEVAAKTTVAERAERPIAAEAAVAGHPIEVNWPLVNARKELTRLRSTFRVVAPRPPVEQPAQVVAHPLTGQATRRLPGKGAAVPYSHSDSTNTHTSNTPAGTTSGDAAAVPTTNIVAAITSSMTACIDPNAAVGPSPGAPTARHPSSVKVYPDIALGMLRREQAATGRVWLLLRAIDVDGRGWLAADETRAVLCDIESPLRLCGRRRLRQLLAQGEGLFWQRDGRDRIWLRGPARVAAGLGVARLGNRPIDVPTATLLGGIGDVRAHLYATFHSGRAREMTNVELRMTNDERATNSPYVLHHSSLGAPIARDTLADLSGVCPRSQAAYERRAGIIARANIALGERVTAGGPPGPAEQERAWRHGRALFHFKDHHGQQGPPRATYLAWRLPNDYGAGRGHRQRPKGRQKRINRQLADLFTKGMTGNGEPKIAKRFFATAAEAIRKGESGISPGGLKAGAVPVTRYWPGRVGRSSHGCGPRVWSVLMDGSAVMGGTVALGGR